MTENISVGIRIKKYLETNGIKQTFLAEKIGMPIQTLSLALKGERKITIEEYVKMCDALNVGIDTFIRANDNGEITV